MEETEQFEQMKKNILGLSMSMDDAPYHGFSRETINGVNFAIDKVLKNTGITIQDLLNEREKKRWFEMHWKQYRRETE
jgi:hypothetical protein